MIIGNRDFSLSIFFILSPVTCREQGWTIFNSNKYRFKQLYLLKEFLCQMEGCQPFCFLYATHLIIEVFELVLTPPKQSSICADSTKQQHSIFLSSLGSDFFLAF